MQFRLPCKRSRVMACARVKGWEKDSLVVIVIVEVMNLLPFASSIFWARPYAKHFTCIFIYIPYIDSMQLIVLSSFSKLRKLRKLIKCINFRQHQVVYLCASEPVWNICLILGLTFCNATQPTHNSVWCDDSRDSLSGFACLRNLLLTYECMKSIFTSSIFASMTGDML